MDDMDNTLCYLVQATTPRFEVRLSDGLNEEDIVALTFDRWADRAYPAE